MKYTKIIGIVLVIASIGIVAAWYAFNGIEIVGHNLPPGVENATQNQLKSIYDGSRQPTEVTSEIVFPSVPEKMVIYTVDRGISEVEIKEIATHLGVFGEIHRGSKIVSIGKGDYVVSGVPSVAFIEYSSLVLEPGYDPQYIDTHLPSDEEARKIADEFLDQHNIRPEGAVFYSTSHNVGHFVSGDDHVEIKNSESINVWYKHWIGEYMIRTDKLRVEVGVHRDVRKMVREWPVYKPYEELSIIAPGEAFEYLKDAGIIIPAGMKSPEKAIVTNVSLVYIDQTMTKDLDYLIPVYYFEGEVQGDGKSASFYQYIPATPEFAAKITSNN